MSRERLKIGVVATASAMSPEVAERVPVRPRAGDRLSSRL
jgi:hypothetical protein